MKEIVLVTLAFDLQTGEVDPSVPFTVHSRRLGTRPCQDEPQVIEQFRTGEQWAWFEAERDDETGDWTFGKRVDHA